MVTELIEAFASISCKATPISLKGIFLCKFNPCSKMTPWHPLECSRVPQLNDDHYCWTLLQWLPHNKECFSGGEFCLAFPINTAIISNVWCLEICAGTLFVMLLKFGAVLSIICGFLMVYTWTHLLQCIVVVLSFLRLLKLRNLAVCKLYLSRGVLLVSRCVRTWIKLTPEYPFKLQSFGENLPQVDGVYLGVMERDQLSSHDCSRNNM